MVKKKKDVTLKHYSFKGKERWYLAGVMIVLAVALLFVIFTSSQFSATGEAKRGLSLKEVTCSGGVKCDGTSVVGKVNQIVCGTDFKNWKCTNLGWVSQKTSCTCGDFICAGGTKCDGTPIVGKVNQVVCGTDGQDWKCTNTGAWAGQGTSCICGEKKQAEIVYEEGVKLYPNFAQDFDKIVLTSPDTVLLYGIWYAETGGDVDTNSAIKVLNEILPKTMTVEQARSFAKIVLAAEYVKQTEFVKQEAEKAKGTMMDGGGQQVNNAAGLNEMKKIVDGAKATCKASGASSAFCDTISKSSKGGGKTGASGTLGVSAFEQCFAKPTGSILSGSKGSGIGGGTPGTGPEPNPIGTTTGPDGGGAGPQPNTMTGKKDYGALGGTAGGNVPCDAINFGAMGKGGQAGEQGQDKVVVVSPNGEKTFIEKIKEKNGDFTVIVDTFGADGKVKESSSKGYLFEADADKAVKEAAEKAKAEKAKTDAEKTEKTEAEKKAATEQEKVKESSSSSSSSFSVEGDSGNPALECMKGPNNCAMDVLLGGEDQNSVFGCEARKLVAMPGVDSVLGCGKGKADPNAFDAAKFFYGSSTGLGVMDASPLDAVTSKTATSKQATAQQSIQSTAKIGTTK